MRGAVMSDADVVLTVGRRLDFQLAYGSPSVFQGAKFVRIGDTPSEMRDNRRGAVEILASPAETLREMVAHAGNRESKVERLWAAKLRSGHEQRAKKLQQSMASAPNGSMASFIRTRCCRRFSRLLEMTPSSSPMAAI